METPVHFDLAAAEKTIRALFSPEEDAKLLALAESPDDLLGIQCEVWLNEFKVSAALTCLKAANAGIPSWILAQALGSAFAGVMGNFIRCHGGEGDLSQAMMAFEEGLKSFTEYAAHPNVQCVGKVTLPVVHGGNA